MNTQTPPTKTAHELALEHVENRAAELSAKHGVKVYGLLFYRANDFEAKADPIYGFLKEPPRLAKFRIMDEATKRGEMEVAAELLEIALLKEESDWRISTEQQEYDDVVMGACLAASQQIIRVAINQFKKK